MKENIQKIHEKYIDEIEVHAKTLIKISEDYGKEIGNLKTARDGVEAGRIVRKDAEKAMLLGVIRFMLDCYMQK